MKKLICVFLSAILLASVAISAAIGASAANTPPDMGVLYDIYYGSAVVDGVKDDSYFINSSTKSYVHNATYEDPSFVYPEGKETSFECWLLWDETSLYGFIEVTDYTPVTYAFKDYKTDCVELDLILTDWSSFAGKKTGMYSDIGNPGVGMFRISNPDGYTASNLYELMPMKGGLAVLDELDSLSKCVTVKTDKGYNIEFSIKIPTEIVHLVCTPGAHIGFGIQCNDDVNDNSVRDAIIFYCNLDDQQGKTGEYILLDKTGVRLDAPVSREPVTTGAPATEPAETTAAPVTDAPVVTTESPAATDAPETTAEEKTEATTHADDVTTAPAPAEKKGCGSFASSAVALLAVVLAGAAVCTKRRK